jgi:phage-related protein (TIGR01555 family)
VWVSLTKRPSSGLFSKVSDAVVSAVHFARFDAWQNVLTGLGGIADKRMWSRFRMSRLLTDQELSDLFHFEWLAKLVVRILPETSMAKGFELQVSEDEGAKKPAKKPAAAANDNEPDEDEDEDEDADAPSVREDAEDAEDLETVIQNRCAELNAWERLKEAAIWGRNYGAGAVYMGVEDGRAPDQPLNWDSVKKLNFLSTLDKRDMTVTEWFTNPTEPRFGEPKIITLYRTQGGGIPDPRAGRGVRVHVDRLLVFGGELTGDREKAANAGWDYSILNCVYDILRDQGMTWASAAVLMQQASQSVYKVKDLTRILGSEQGEEELQKRFRMIEMSRSVARAICVDAEGEDLVTISPTFTGIPDLLQQFCNQLAAATRIPVTILMGQAPAGLNATGASDLRTWEGECVKWQIHVLKPRLERLVRVLLLEQGKEPETWTISFPAIATETPMERATLRKTIAETDAIYIKEGVTLPEEIAKSRFPAEGYSTETQIDLELRDELEDEKKEGLLEAAQAGGNPQNLGTAGAQVDALQKITDAVASGTIDQETGVARVVALFAVTAEQAEKMLGEVKAQPQGVQPGEVPGQPTDDPDLDEAAQLLGEVPTAPTPGAKPKKPGAPRTDAEREFERAEDGTFGSGHGVRGPAKDKPAGDKPALKTKDENEARGGLKAAVAAFRSDPSDENRAAVAVARDELRGHLSTAAEERRTEHAAEKKKPIAAAASKAKKEPKAKAKKGPAPKESRKEEPAPKEPAQVSTKPEDVFSRAGYTPVDPSDPAGGYQPLTPEQMSGPTSPGVSRLSAADLAKHEPQHIVDSLPRIVSDNGTIYDDKIWISDYRAATGASDKDIDEQVRAGKLSLKAFDFAHNSPGQSERRAASLLKRDRSEYLALGAKPLTGKK